MKETQYILHKGDIFTYRLIQRNEKALVWQVEIEAPLVDIVTGTIKIHESGLFAFFPTINPILTHRRLNCLSSFLELVNKEQNIP